MICSPVARGHFMSSNLSSYQQMKIAHISLDQQVVGSIPAGLTEYQGVAKFVTPSFFNIVTISYRAESLSSIRRRYRSADTDCADRQESFPNII